MEYDFSLNNAPEINLLIPQALLTNKKYRELDSSAILLYTILLDDMKEKAIKENWIDEARNLYVLYSSKRLLDLLNITLSELSTIKKQLQSADLIEINNTETDDNNKIYLKKVEQ